MLHGAPQWCTCIIYQRHILSASACIYSWNPNDPCFASKRGSFRGKTGVIWVPGIYTYDSYDIRMITFFLDEFLFLGWFWMPFLRACPKGVSHPLAQRSRAENPRTLCGKSLMPSTLNARESPAHRDRLPIPKQPSTCDSWMCDQMI